MEQVSKLIRSDYIFKIGETTHDVECTMPRAGEGGSVISYSASAIVTATEALNGECSVRGKVNFKVIVKSGDELSSLDYFADYETTVKGSVLPTMKILSRAEVSDCDVRLDVESAIGSATVSITLFGLSLQEIPALVSAEGACLNEGKTTSCALAGVFEATTTVYDELDAGKIKDVILTGSGVCVREVSVQKGVVKVLGEARAKILYRTEDGVYTHIFSATFAEEIEATGAGDLCRATASATVSNVKLVLSGTEDDTEIRAEITLSLCADVWKTEEVDVITDAFCTDCELIVEQCAKVSSLQATTRLLTGEAKRSVTTPADLPLIDKLVGSVSEWNVTTNLALEKDSVLVEGVVSGGVLYHDREGGLNVVKYELPYSIDLDAEGVAPGDTVLLSTDVIEVSAYARGENEIELTARLGFSLSSYQSSSTCAVISCKEGESISRDTHPITIKFGEAGASLWQTAKSLCVAPDTLLETNPDLTFPLIGGEKIIEYHPIICE